MELDTTIKALRTILDLNDIECSDDTFLDCAVRLYNTSRINANKGPAAKPSIYGNAATVVLATEKQKLTLQKFGIEFNANISKSEASQLISKKIATLN